MRVPRVERGVSADRDGGRYRSGLTRGIERYHVPEASNRKRAYVTLRGPESAVRAHRGCFNRVIARLSTTANRSQPEARRFSPSWTHRVYLPPPRLFLDSLRSTREEIIYPRGSARVEIIYLRPTPRVYALARSLLSLDLRIRGISRLARMINFEIRAPDPKAAEARFRANQRLIIQPKIPTLLDFLFSQFLRDTARLSVDPYARLLGIR